MISDHDHFKVVMQLFENYGVHYFKNIKYINETTLTQDKVYIYLPIDQYNEICWKAISKDPKNAFDYIIQLNEFPTKLDFEIYLACVKHKGLEDCPFDIEKFNQAQRKQIYLAAVKEKYSDLQFIPVDQLDMDIYFESIKNHVLAFKYIDADEVDDENYKKLCLAAVKINGMTLKFIKIDKCDMEILSEAVSQRGRSIQYIIADGNTISKLGAENVRKLCLAAVNNNGLALQHIPIDHRNIDIYLQSVKQNENALQYMSENEQKSSFTPEQYRTICFSAVKKHGECLQWVLNRAIFTDDEYQSLCLDAVKQNPDAFQYIKGDEIKKYIIDQVGVDHILRNNYGQIKYFPELTDTKGITDFLSNIAHIVVTKNDDFYQDKETNDVYMIYANHIKRKGKTLHVNENDLERLLADIEKMTLEKVGKLNLVLLDHTSEKSSKMADMNAEGIANFIANHNKISRVTLLGCRTAASKPLNKEVDMIKAYQEEEKKQRLNTKAGLMISYTLPSADNYEKLFKTKTGSKGYPNTLYILCRNPNPQSTPTAWMLELKKDDSNIISERRYDLNEEMMKKLGGVIGNKKNIIPKATDKKQIDYYRGTNNTDFLTLNEIAEMDTILNANAPRFSKAHPHYKQDKKRLPFLTGAEVDTNEIDKIESVLFKSLDKAINADDRIKRHIEIKGYTKGLHADTVENRMIVTKGHLYKRTFQEYTETLFGKAKDNINRGKLKEERDKNIKMSESGEIDKESSFKSITKIVKK